LIIGDDENEGYLQYQIWIAFMLPSLIIATSVSVHYSAIILFVCYFRDSCRIYKLTSIHQTKIDWNDATMPKLCFKSFLLLNKKTERLIEVQKQLSSVTIKIKLYMFSFVKQKWTHQRWIIFHHKYGLMILIICNYQIIFVRQLLESKRIINPLPIAWAKTSFLDGFYYFERDKLVMICERFSIFLKTSDDNEFLACKIFKQARQWW